MMFKKIMTVTLLLVALTLCVSAAEAEEGRKTKFFKGYSAAFNVSGGSKTEISGYDETKQELTYAANNGVFYYVSGKVSFGVVPDKNKIAGIRLGVSYSNKDVDDSYSTSFIRDYVIKYLGQTDIDPTSLGLDASYLTPKFAYDVTVFCRQKLMDVSFVPKLSVWLEAKGIFKQSWDLISQAAQDAMEGKKDPWGDRTSTLTVRIHPVISYDVDENMCISTSIDAISLFGQYKMKSAWSTGEKTSSYSAGLQPVSLQTMFQTVINVSVIKKF